MRRARLFVLPAALLLLAGCGNNGDVVATGTTQPSATLEDYKTQMRDVLTRPNVVFLDADESCDCITVGISDPSAATDVESFASSVGIPANRVRTIIRPPIVTLQTLRTGIRPIKGGLQIQNEDRGHCTMMATVFHRGRAKKGLLTNSHCTRTQGAVDGIEFFQAGGALFSSDFVAREVLDPAFSGDPAGCPTGRQCRESDAAFAEFDTSTVGIVGRLARPSSTCTGTTVCSLAMSSTGAELAIVGVAGRPVFGDTLDKIGRTTGWTRGTVRNTCVSINAKDNGDTGNTMLCDHIVGAASGLGDSGSPVFVFGQNATVRLAGILWGGATDGSDFVFSSIHDIEAELGAFDYHE